MISKRSLSPMRLEALHRLPDRAVALFYAIKELGGHPSLDELMSFTAKSAPSIYRALADLFDAGHKAELSPRSEPQAKPTRTQPRSYTV